MFGRSIKKSENKDKNQLSTVEQDSNKESNMKRNKEKISKPVDTIDTLIGAGSVLQGDLEFTGGLRVDGHIRGHVTAQDSSNGMLVLSESGIVEGDINVPHVVVNGTVKGNIASKGHIELQANAKIEGDVHYKAVEMELGAVLNGSLVSDSAAPVYEPAAGQSAAPEKKKLEPSK